MCATKAEKLLPVGEPIWLQVKLLLERRNKDQFRIVHRDVVSREASSAQFLVVSVDTNEVVAIGLGLQDSSRRQLKAFVHLQEFSRSYESRRIAD